MAAWDIFYSDRGEVARGLRSSEVRRLRNEGQIGDDDLIRASGSNAGWTPVRDVPALAVTAPGDAPTLPPPATGEPRPPSIFDDDSDDSTEAISHDVLDRRDQDSAVALPVTGPDTPPTPPRVRSRPTAAAVVEPAPPAPRGEEEEEEPFSLGAEGPEDEELDLTAMVDVAFQLILFFLVTATSVYFKSLQIPTPDPEKQKSAQQAAKKLDDLELTNIIVEIDARGQITVDHEPIASDSLIPKLRAARDATGRTALILMADSAAKHRTTIRVIEAANEIGLSPKLGRLGGSGGGGDPSG